MPTDPTRTIPALPNEINGVPVAEWSRWEPELVLSHADPGCTTCGDPGPGCTAVGYEHHRGGLRYRWHAHRCRACDETRIHERRTDPETLRRTSVEVVYRAARTRSDAPQTRTHPRTPGAPR